MAVALQRRRGATPSIHSSHIRRLQRGRRPSATESRAVRRRHRLCLRCFNVAVALQRRRGVTDVQSLTACESASTWPSPFSDGEGAVAGGGARNGRASTWPSPFSDGEVIDGRTGRPHAPRLQRGRRPSATESAVELDRRIAGAGVLQRGRRPSATESSKHSIDRYPNNDGLQRGRRPSATESRREVRAHAALLVASTWPSPFSDGERRVRLARADHQAASTWPSPFSDGETARASQPRRIAAGADHQAASTWPSPFSDGERTACRTSRGSASGFNVAVALQRRRAIGGCCDSLDLPASTWPSPFSDGEDRARSREASRALASTWPSPFSDGELVHLAVQSGAVLLQRGRRPSATERRGALRFSPSASLEASTWPSPFSDGESTLGRPSSADPSSFNVAVALQRRRGSSPPSGCWTATSFNVAVALQRRRGVEALRRDAGAAGFNVAVALQRRRALASRCAATHGQACFNVAVALQRRRARSTSAPRTSTTCFNVAVALQRRRDGFLSRKAHPDTGFNVAVALQRRRVLDADGHVRRLRASTWPSPFSDGESFVGGQRSRERSALQRGRRPSATERRENRKLRVSPAHALQRGRRPSATESRTRCMPCFVSKPLQRGRRPSARERSGPAPTDARRCGFNVAVALQRRRVVGGQFIVQVRRRLQRGRRPSATERRASRCS